MIYLFNPDNESAQAEKGRNYIAPEPVRQMAADLAALPLWMADETDAILLPHPLPEDYLLQTAPLFTHHPRPRILTPHTLTKAERAESLCPWGWNPTLIAKLSRMGFTRLPDTGLLSLHLQEASRNSLPFLDEALMTSGLTCAGRRHYCVRDVTELEQLLTSTEALRHNGFLLKEPFSSSGRGLRWCRHGLNDEVRNYVRRVIGKQKSITLEPIYDKVADLAMEFVCPSPGEVRFAGYSLFETNTTGAYQSNLLADNRAIETDLGRYLSPNLLKATQETLCQVISCLYPTHCGPLGVDQLIYRHPGTGAFTLHPDVEVNLRPTMGYLARRFYDRFMRPGSKGRLYVESSPSSNALWQRHIKDIQSHPLRLHDGRLSDGYLPLTPVTQASRFRAYVLAEASR